MWDENTIDNRYLQQYSVEIKCNIYLSVVYITHAEPV